MNENPKTPALLNAEQLVREHPDTFERPSEMALRTLLPGDHVKVCLPCAGELRGIPTNGERFWVLLSRVEYPVLEGVVVNELQTDKLAFGDRIRFATCNVYLIEPPTPS